MHRVHKRLSLLKKNPALSRQAFFSHYEKVHGPLASSQAGFRKFTYCYIQNHILSEYGRAGEPEFDGMTVTYQVPREDMTRGFFQEPDYASVVRPDEERLFDLSRTVSVLGVERIVLAGTGTAWKCIAAFPRTAAPGFVPDVHDGGRSQGGFPGLRRLVVNDLIPTTAGALGGVPRPLGFHCIAELWFDDESSMNRAARDDDLPALLEAERPERRALRAFHVREVVMFSEMRADPG
jgi:hypothetical protein